jgi:hypothetical protein
MDTPRVEMQMLTRRSLGGDNGGVRGEQFLTLCPCGFTASHTSLDSYDLIASLTGASYAQPRLVRVC